MGLLLGGPPSGRMLSSLAIDTLSTRSSRMDVSPEDLARVDFNDHSTNWRSILAVTIFSMIVIPIIISLRLWTRFVVTKSIFIDDGTSQRCGPNDGAVGLEGALSLT